MLHRAVLLLLVVGLVVALTGSQAWADDVDPTGKTAIGFVLYSGWDLTMSKGFMERTSMVQRYVGRDGFSRPLGLRRFVIRHYTSPGFDIEFGMSIYRLSQSGDGIEDGQSATEIPLSLGFFSRSSLGDEAHMRAGGRINMDILHVSASSIWSGESETYTTFGFEGIWGIEWFVTKHFSLTPQVLLGLELSNEDTNADITMWYTGFELMVTVLP